MSASGCCWVKRRSTMLGPFGCEFDAAFKLCLASSSSILTSRVCTASFGLELKSAFVFVGHTGTQKPCTYPTYHKQLPLGSSLPLPIRPYRHIPSPEPPLEDNVLVSADLAELHLTDFSAARSASSGQRAVAPLQPKATEAPSRGSQSLPVPTSQILRHHTRDRHAVYPLCRRVLDNDWDLGMVGARSA